MEEKRTIKIGIVGFGTVGSGTLKVLWERKPEIEKELGVEIQVKKVVDKDWSRERSVVLPPE
ncbi:MAG: homoserine dehydrogenase, partial [Candidatus Caldatribacteriaceae bacterium]